MSDSLENETAPEEVVVAPAPKKRGRPRKVVSETTEAAAAAEAEPKPKTTRKRSTTKAADETAAAVTETEASEEASAAPKKRGRARKTAAAEEAPAAVAVESEEKPAPKKRTRTKAAASESSEVLAEGPNVPTAEPVAESVSEEEKKPAKRGPRSKKSAEQAEEKDDLLAAQAAILAQAQALAAAEGGREKADSKDAKTSETSSSDVSDGVGDSITDTTGEGEGTKQLRKSVRVKGQNGQLGTPGGQNGKQRQKQASSNNQTQNNRQKNNNQAYQQNNRNARSQRRQHQQREIQPSVTREELEELRITELRKKAAELGLNPAGVAKADLVNMVFEAILEAEGFAKVGGILDILSDGYGFLRTSGYLPCEHDVYVGAQVIKRNNLRKGDYVTGQTRPSRENDKFAALQTVATVNGRPLEELGHRVKFGDLTPVYPDEVLTMEHGHSTITARVIDLVSPIGKGQRGLIVSPPKAGKTTILKDIAAAISANNPEVHLMCLLVDERPEEVTDMERSVKGEVISSTFDMPTENHITVAELVIERAKRLVEDGKDVVILLDSITRLARAYNLAQPASGRILSGGVDSTALYPPKRFLGAARNIENGGSLTILASALVDTGSKMDEVIFEEFKGTGNMELKLDRNLADRRIFPAIDPVASGTRKEELLLKPQEAPLIWGVRRILANMNNTERSMDMLIKSLKQTEDNAEFLVRTAKKAQRSKEGITEL